MAQRVHKKTLPEAEYWRLCALSGLRSGVSGPEDYPALSASLRELAGVSDASVKHVVPEGPDTVVYVESETFPELTCCWKKNATEWPVTLFPREVPS